MTVVDAQNTPIAVQTDENGNPCFTMPAGEVYLRVVDYKTGKKEYKDGDLPKGLNLQLLISLDALLRCDGVAQLCGGEPGDTVKPAGILYFACMPDSVKLSAPPDEETT